MVVVPKQGRPLESASRPLSPDSSAASTMVSTSDSEDERAAMWRTHHGRHAAQSRPPSPCHSPLRFLSEYSVNAREQQPQ